MVVSKTDDLVQTILRQIEAGTLRPGDRLPSTAELRK
jgi:DNA-binding FadR family transcriptional regulator